MSAFDSRLLLPRPTHTRLIKMRQNEMCIAERLKISFEKVSLDNSTPQNDTDEPKSTAASPHNQAEAKFESKSDLFNQIMSEYAASRDFSHPKLPKSLDANKLAKLTRLFEKFEGYYTVMLMPIEESFENATGSCGRHVQHRLHGSDYQNRDCRSKRMRQQHATSSDFLNDDESGSSTSESNHEYEAALECLNDETSEHDDDDNNNNNNGGNQRDSNDDSDSDETQQQKQQQHGTTSSSSASSSMRSLCSIASADNKPTSGKF